MRSTAGEHVFPGCWVGVYHEELLTGYAVVLPCDLLCVQRLVDENKQQQDMLVQLVQRLDDVEAALQALQAERARKSFFGGFIGPKALL